MSKKVNVLFVNLPSIPLAPIVKSFESKNVDEQINFWSPASMPMGILYLSACMKKYAGDVLGDVAMIDYVVELNEMAQRDYKNIDEFFTIPATKIGFRPDIIAFSVIFSTSYPFFTENIKKLKELWPEAVTAVGGIHQTNYGKKVFNDAPVDYLFVGEGERSFSKFLRQFANSESIDIKGVYSRESAKLDDAVEHAEQITDLNELPFPDWDLIDMAYYTLHGRVREISTTSGHRMATIMTVRGCPHHCTFCSAHTVHGRKMRCRSVKNVIAEIKHLNSEYGVNLIIPEDDMFTIPRGRVIELLKEIAKLDIKDFELQLPSALSINSLDEEIMDLLIAAKMKIACLAIESGSEYVQNHIIKKHCDLNKAREVVKYFKSKNIIVRCYFILGFFSETKEHMQETVEYVKTLGADWSAFFIAVPLIGSEMYKQFLDAGYIREDMDFWTSAHYMQRGFDTPEIGAQELMDFAYMANLECNFLNNINKVNGQYQRAIDIYKDIVLRYPFHVIGWYCMAECYEKLGNREEVKNCEETIRELIKSDNRAIEMYSKYSYLMPLFNK